MKVNETTKPRHGPARGRVSVQSIAFIVLAWLILQIGGIFSPGLLDDVDSIYIEVAREMLHRHDFVTPYIDGVRFFDKPPLLYWLAASSMRLLGEYDWAARLPLALAVLALLLAIYGLGLRLYAQVSPSVSPDRGALYGSLAMATAIGPYLYTRFFIPDILIALWLTLSVHLFLIALNRAACKAGVALEEDAVAHTGSTSSTNNLRTRASTNALLPCLLLSATLGLSLLTKGFIGLIFPLAFIFLYLLLTNQFGLLPKLHLVPSILVFLAVALPWHIVAALRNPAIAMPPGLGLPARAGWAWFYLYNEHVARFAGKRLPHDYGQTPVWLFWLYALLWVMPWGAFLPAAFVRLRSHLGHRLPVTVRQREAALVTTLWTLIVLVFFTLSSRQEYYSLPALPALTLLIGGVLAAADQEKTTSERQQGEARRHPHLSLHFRSTAGAARNVLLCHGWLLLPLVSVIATVCAYLAITAPRPRPGTDLAGLLGSHPELYNLSLGHLFDLTSAAMSLFRGPLLAVAAGMLILGPLSFMLRRSRHTYSANLTLAAGMIPILLAAHEALVRFNPILGSKELAQAIVAEQSSHLRPGDLILIDGELTSGSTLLFYTRQPVHLVNGRMNGPWFGSFWPETPPIFETESTLRTLWHSPHRVFLLTYSAALRTRDLRPYAPVRTIAASGGKTILTNR